jgi:hypothetical protein
MGTWRRQTAAQLLAAQDLGFISVWSPTFLIELMQWLTRDLPQTLRALPPPNRRHHPPQARPRAPQRPRPLAWAGADLLLV